MIHRRNIIFAGVALAVVAVGLTLLFKGSDERATTQAVVLNVPPPVSEPHEPSQPAVSPPSTEVSLHEQSDDTPPAPAESHAAVTTEESVSSTAEPSVIEIPKVDQSSEDHVEGAPGEEVAAAGIVEDVAQEPQTEAPLNDSDTGPIGESHETPEAQHMEPVAGDTLSEGHQNESEMSAPAMPSSDLVVTRGVNLRSKPSTASLILGFVPVGERLQRQGPEVEQGYYRVAWGEREGWVWQKNVADAEPLPSANEGDQTSVETEDAPAEHTQDNGEQTAAAAVTNDAPGEESVPQTDITTSVEETETNLQSVSDVNATSAVSVTEIPGSSEQPAEDHTGDQETAELASAQEAQPETEETLSKEEAVPAVVTMNVNMRAEPTKESRILITLRKGHEVQQLDDEPVRGYFLVEYGDLKGWVWRRAIELKASKVTAEDTASAH